MRTLPTRPRCQCRARVPDDQDAYLEAYEIYDQAVKLSRLQTRYELESAWQAESETGELARYPLCLAYRPSRLPWLSRYQLAEPQGLLP